MEELVEPITRFLRQLSDSISRVVHEVSSLWNTPGGQSGRWLGFIVCILVLSAVICLFVYIVGWMKKSVISPFHKTKKRVGGRHPEKSNRPRRPSM